MGRVSVKYVPCLVTKDQRQSWFTVCQYCKIKFHYCSDRFSKAIIGDKGLCYGYDLDSKQASSQWKITHRTKKSKTCQMSRRCIFFLSSRDCVQGIHSPWTESIRSIVWELRDIFMRMCQGNAWFFGNWFLYHDIALIHTSLIMQWFLTSKSMALISHLPYPHNPAPWSLCMPYLQSLYRT